MATKSFSANNSMLKIDKSKSKIEDHKRSRHEISLNSHWYIDRKLILSKILSFRENISRI